MMKMMVVIWVILGDVFTGYFLIPMSCLYWVLWRTQLAWLFYHSTYRMARSTTSFTRAQVMTSERQEHTGIGTLAWGTLLIITCFTFSGIIVDQVQGIRFAVDIAKGMAYLHSLEQLIPRLYLKSTHIMVQNLFFQFLFSLEFSDII